MTQLPWHPTMFAATIVLAYWLDSAVSPHAALRGLAIGVGGAAALTAILTLATRRPAAAGLAVSGLIGLLYSKHVFGFAAHLGSLAPTWAFVLWMLLVAVAIAAAGRLAWRAARTWTATGANRVLNGVAILYLASTVALGVTSGKVAYAAAELHQGLPLSASATSAATSTADSSAPDMYVVLVDGYPRADVLAEAMNIDNASFVEGLGERGFDVAAASHSNYLWTHQSLTSMLHMDYVHNIPEFQAVLENRVPADPTLRELVNDNPVFDLARDHGYQVVSTGYPFDQTALRQADVFVDEGGFMNEFELTLLVSTFLGDVVAVVAPDFASSQHRGQIENQMNELVEIAGADSSIPRVVFGHIPAPHQPAVFGPHGEPVVVPVSESFYADSPQERGEPADEFVERYRDQLVYLNGRILETVDAILAASAEPPVIVLWADHGSSSRADWTVTSPDEAPPNLLRERTATLFASQTPGRSGAFPNDITPASIFRFLADAYLGTDLGRAAAPDGEGDR